MATRLAAGVRDLPSVEISHPVQANAVFVNLPAPALADLHTQFTFYDWPTGPARWMTSFDTTEEDVDALVKAVRTAVTR